MPSNAQKLANTISTSKLVKKIPAHYLPRIAAAGYFVALVSVALLISQSLVTGMKASSTLEYVLTYIAGISYIPIGYLSGFVSSANTYQSIRNLVPKIENEAQRKNAKKYQPGGKRFDALEVTQASLVAIIILALIGFTISRITSNDFWTTATQFIINSVVSLASATRALENAWLGYRDGQIKEIYKNDLISQRDAAVAEKQSTEERVQRLRDGIAQKEQEIVRRNHIITRLEGENKRISVLEKQIGASLRLTQCTSAQQKAVLSPNIIIWLEKGLSASDFGSLNDDEANNIKSNVVTSLLENVLLTLTQALSLSHIQRAILEHPVFIDFAKQQEIMPADILALPVQDIDIKNLNRKSITELIEAGRLSLLDAIQLQRYHRKELDRQRNGVALLWKKSIDSHTFFSLTVEQLKKLNEVKADRVAKVFEMIRLISNFLSLPTEIYSYRLAAINDDVTLTYLEEGIFVHKINQVQDETSLYEYINHNRSESHYPPSTSSPRIS